MKPNSVLFAAEVSSPASLNAAIAMHEAGLLGAYYSKLVLRSNGGVMSIAALIDGLAGSDMAPQIKRRVAEGIPDNRVHGFSWLEVARTLLSRSGVPSKRLAAISKLSSRNFDRHVACRAPHYPVIYGMRSGVLKSFEVAKRNHGFCILNVGSLDPDYVRGIEQSEASKLSLPLKESNGDWLDEREARARAMDLADLVIFTSQLALASHRLDDTQAGKARVIPLGFPKPCNHVRRRDNEQPLRVLWAGAFSVMKGAHHLCAALERLSTADRIEVQVFGKQELPASVLVNLEPRIRISPTIPRGRLMEEYRRADVLVMPTLSDGFGMVISEAMSQGLPVITTDRAGASAFIRGGENGLIVPAGVPEALADALVWCARHRPELRAMGDKALLTASSWQWADYRKALAHAVTAAIDDFPDLAKLA